MKKHSETPWRLEQTCHGSHSTLFQNGNIVGLLFHGLNDDGIRGETNADFTLKAINAHDTLVKLLEIVVSDPDLMDNKLPASFANQLEALGKELL